MAAAVESPITTACTPGSVRVADCCGAVSGSAPTRSSRVLTLRSTAGVLCAVSSMPPTFTTTTTTRPSDDGLGHLPVRLAGDAGHRDQQDHGEARRDERLPLEVAGPALGQLLAEVQLELARAIRAQHVRDLVVDGDVGELEERPDRALELRLGRHHLAEQVELAGTGQAGRRDGRADLGGLPGGGYRLQRRHLQGQPDRARRDDREGDEVERRGPGQSQDCGNVAIPLASRRPSTLPRDREKVTAK